MARNYNGPKTCTHITWPNGSTTHVVKRGRWWKWTTAEGNEAASSHLGNVKAQANYHDAKIQQVTHPDYIHHLNQPQKRLDLAEAIGLDRF